MTRTERAAGNLALTTALITVNTIRALVFLAAWALTRKNPDWRNLKLPGRDRY